MQIQRNFHGERTIVSEHDGARIVNTGGGRGYLQRAYITRGGRSYYSRTYLDHGVYRVGIYRGYEYGGHHYYGYYPAYWYRPGFYAWAYRPWATPVYWDIGLGGWGWAGARWYGYYGAYFAPYPAYSSPAFWLTDYLIAANLQAAYAARTEANADAAAGYGQEEGNGDIGDSANAGSSMLTPEAKQAIADEVKAQLAAEQRQASDNQSGEGQGGGVSEGQAQNAATASGEALPALDPARRTFVVFTEITVTSGGQECELSAGDVITRLTDTPDDDQNVTASVSISKKKECAAGKQVLVSVEALQEMHNHFVEQLDSGMKQLADKQGTAGLPKAPDTGTKASDVQPPPPDTNVAKELADQQAAADQTEAQAEAETDGGPNGEQSGAPGSSGPSLAETARQLRAKKPQVQAESDPRHAQDVVDDIQDELEDTSNATSDFKTYNAGDYKLRIPAPFTVSGSEDGGTVLSSVTPAGSRSFVMVGNGLPFADSKSDAAFAEYAEHYTLLYSPSTSCEKMNLGRHDAFKCGLASAKLSGHIVSGSAVFVRGAQSIFPVFCTAPSDSWARDVYNNTPENRRAKTLAAQTLQKENEKIRATWETCDLVVQSIHLKEDDRPQPRPQVTPVKAVNPN